MRIGDQILINGKSVTPIKPSGVNTSRRHIQGLRPLNNRNTSELPQAQILASKILPDNSVLYLINQHRSSSPPTWEERSKLFPIHQAAIEKFERKSKAFMCTQHNIPSNQMNANESPLRVSSQNQTSPSSESINSKRKICIGGKSPFGTTSPSPKLHSETLQEAMKQGYITKNSFKMNETGQISNRQLFQEENTTTATSSSSDKKNNKIFNKQEQKFVQQAEIVKEYTNGLSHNENYKYQVSQIGLNEKQQENHKVLNQQDNLITKENNTNVICNTKLPNKNHLEDPQKEKQPMTPEKSRMQDGRSVFGVLNNSPNSRLPQKIIQEQPPIKQVNSDQSCLVEEKNHKYYQVNSNDKQRVQITEEPLIKASLFDANTMQDTNHSNSIQKKKSQNEATTGNFQTLFEKQSIIVAKQKSGPIIAVENLKLTEKTQSEKEEEELLNEYRKHDIYAPHSQSEQEQKEETNSSPFLLRLEKSKSQKVETLSFLLKPIVSNLSDKDKLNKPSENHKEPTQAHTLESHIDDKITQKKIVSEQPRKGDFVYGDKAKKITACRPKENDILMDIEWEPRANGSIPEKSAVSSKAVRIFDSDLLIDFYESKIKFTYNNNDKKKQATQQQQQQAAVKKEYLSPPNPKQ